MKQDRDSSRSSPHTERRVTHWRSVGALRSLVAPSGSRAIHALLLASLGGLAAWLTLSALTPGGVTLPGAAFFNNAVTRWRPGAVIYASASPRSSRTGSVLGAHSPLACANSGESATGANLVIPAGEIVCGDVLVVGGNLDTLGDVQGSAQVIGGNATISGSISGNVTTIGGNITLLAGASVSGAAHAVGGTVSVTPGATISNVGGDLQEPADIARAPGLNFAVDAGSFWLSLLFWMSAALGLTTVAPEMVGRVRYTISRHAAVSGLAGLFLVVLAFVLAIVLVVTCIGIPIALFIAIAAWAAWVVGTVGLGAWVGSVIFGGPRRAPSLVMSSLLGVLALSLLKELPIAGPLIGAIAGAIALGGAALTVLSARKYAYYRPR